MRLFFLSGIIFCLSFHCLAQQKTGVFGKVLDENDQPLQSVSIQI